MNKKKILIVDDDEDLAKGLRVRLRAENYTVGVATDGISATSEAKKESPDLILLDLGLPAGDGFVVMERLSNIESVASVPIIVLSARDPETNKKRALDAGATAYLQKPVDNDELLIAIRKALGTEF
jgi:two-component system KDP operon response regulator KdpE